MLALIKGKELTLKQKTVAIIKLISTVSIVVFVVKILMVLARVLLVPFSIMFVLYVAVQIIRDK